MLETPSSNFVLTAVDFRFAWLKVAETSVMGAPPLMTREACA